jgi:hypothetical protein
MRLKSQATRLHFSGLAARNHQRSEKKRSVRLAANFSWRDSLRSSVFYRIASVLLVLFAAGHTLGFRRSDPAWRAEPVLALMQSQHFQVQGFGRSYWDFFVGFGLFVSVFVLFAAILAWQLGSLAPETLARMRVVAWAFAFCFFAITVLSWTYFFVIPLVFSLAITICVFAAAGLTNKPA